MSWLGRGRPPRKSVGGHENSLRDAMRLSAGVVLSHGSIGAVVRDNLVSRAREVQIAVTNQISIPCNAVGTSRGGITIRPPTAPTDIEDNEPVPEKSTLDWLNLNALAPKAIQGAIDRIRHNTLASSGDAEVPKEMDGELLTSPRGKGTDQSAGSMGYARPARKSLSSALRARGGISRGVAGTESDPAEGPDADAPDVPEPSSPEVPLDEAESEATPVEAAAPVPEEAEEAVPEEPQPSESPEAAFAQPTADRTASAPLPVLHEEEEEESTIAAAMPVQVEQPDERAAPDALDGLAEAEELPNQEELPDRREVPAELEESEEAERVQTDSVPEQDHATDSEVRKPKDWEEPTTRLPMPTPLMAATASARRAAPPSVVDAPKMEEASQEPAGKPLLAPEPHLRVQTRDVGKLKELREFWGNKSSKGFAGPGLTGSRLSKNEAQATLQRLLIAGGDFDEVLFFNLSHSWSSQLRGPLDENGLLMSKHASGLFQRLSV
ncbi:rlmN [Symbiodinium microadriaticum]|nr:rlmN [Symbiodinium microadriaticum]